MKMDEPSLMARIGVGVVMNPTVVRAAENALWRMIGFLIYFAETSVTLTPWKILIFPKITPG